MTGPLVYLTAREHATELTRSAAAARAVRAQRAAQQARHLHFRLGSPRASARAVRRHFVPGGC
jgi:hypothetical protein